MGAINANTGGRRSRPTLLNRSVRRSRTCGQRNPLLIAASERSNLLINKQLFDLSEAVNTWCPPTSGSAPTGRITRG